MTPGDEFPYISEQGRGSQLGGLDRHRVTAAPPGAGGVKWGGQGLGKQARLISALRNYAAYEKRRIRVFMPRRLEDGLPRPNTGPRTRQPGRRAGGLM